MMGRLLEAVRPDARLVLVGDPNQLASVEAGAVLGDLAAAWPAGAAAAGWRVGLAHAQLPLRDDSGIGLLAEAMQTGDADAVLASLRGAARRTSRPADGPRGCRRPSARGPRSPTCEAPWSAVAQLAAFDAFRVLCAHRRGPHGVEVLGQRTG